jgi:hypothetical protein
MRDVRMLIAALVVPTAVVLALTMAVWLVYRL